MGCGSHSPQNSWAPRIPPKTSQGRANQVLGIYDLDEFDKQLHQWCREAAGEDGYKIKWIQRFHAKNLTSVEKGNKWWDAFSSVMDGFGAKLIKTIFPG